MTQIPRPLITKSLALIKELNRFYGAEKAHEIWSNISDAVGDDGELKMEIFKSMMQGETGDSIIINRWYGDNKIAGIKLLRHWTHEGLKEAKWAIEGAATGKVGPFKLAGYHTTDTMGDKVDIDYITIMAEFKAHGMEIEFV